jgi:hypothetical protein
MRESINVYTIGAVPGFVKRNRELHERSGQSCWRNVAKRPWEIGAEGVVGGSGGERSLRSDRQNCSGVPGATILVTI